MNTQINWDNMRALLARLRQHAENGTEHKFDMGEWCEMPVNPDERRSRDQETCYTSACLAGHAAMMTGKVGKSSPSIFAPPVLKTGPFTGSGVTVAATRFLGLNHDSRYDRPSSYAWMFYGLWHPSMSARRQLSYITGITDPSAMSLNDAILYLEKAIQTRDVFVTIDDEVR